MEPAKLELALKRAPDDPKINDPEIQKQFGQASRILSEAGICYSVRGMAFDSVNTPGYGLGEFIIPLAQTVGPVVGVIVGAWLKERFGRKVRIKVGEIEAEATSVDEVTRLLAKIEEFREGDD